MLVELAMLWSISGAANGSDCVKKTASALFEAHSGTLVHENGLPVEAGSQIRLLSDGKMGKSSLGGSGRVFLVTPPQNGKPFVLKKYYLRVSAEEDLRAFTFLHDIRGLGGNTGSRFDVVGVRSTSDPLIHRLDYTPGVDLGHLLMDSNLSPEVRKQLEFKFDEMRNNLDRDISAATTRHTAKEGNTYKVWRGPQKPFRIEIRVDQIIVNPTTLEMTIIDPR